MSEQKKERDIVIAVFKEKKKAQKAIAKNSAAATSIELVADEAIIVTKNEDDTLTISRSDHSAKRSLTVMTAKLMVAVPLGFTGALALTTAGLEVTGAARKRDAPTDVDDVDIAFLIEKMLPGWSAVLAAYQEKYVDKAVSTFEKLGAVIVWYAPESRVEEVVKQNRIEL